MKTFRLLFIFTAALMLAVSCSEDENADMEVLSAKKTMTYDMDAWRAAMPDFCGPVQYHDLIGGQTILMGSVAVANDGTYLYVKYEADPGYVITETHLFIGDVMDGDFPKTKKGNPKIGHFPYASENYEGSQVVVYNIAIEDIDGDCFDVAAHAVVECEDGSCEETAWGAGRQPQDVILAAKVWYNVKAFDYWSTFGLTEGLFFSEDCSWAPTWGYIPLDLENFTPGTYNISENGVVYGTISTSIADEKLVLTIEAINENELEGRQFIFVGTLDELNSYIDSYGCPRYYDFPYQDGPVIEIPLSELPAGESEEALDLGATRWGFYMEYCITSCD